MRCAVCCRFDRSGIFGFWLIPPATYGVVSFHDGFYVLAFRNNVFCACNEHFDFDCILGGCGANVFDMFFA